MGEEITIFDKIVKKEIPASIVYEDELVYIYATFLISQYIYIYI